MTQTDAILADLRRGKVLTAAEAIRRHKTMRLAARIYDLKRRGIRIHSTLVHKGNKKWAAYWIPV